MIARKPSITAFILGVFALRRRFPWLVSSCIMGWAKLSALALNWQPQRYIRAFMRVDGFPAHQARARQ
jgi:hypothetical protein